MSTISVEAWRRGGGHFTWRGHRIFTRTEGRGEPLLLIHGYPTASWDWAPIWPALAARYRVLALDLIGFGFSAKPRTFPYSIAAQADLIEAFLASQQVTGYRVLAHDYGDTVTQELLARSQAGGAATIRSVCLLNGGLFPETHRARPVQRLLASPVGPLFARLAGYRAFAAGIQRTCARPLDRATLRGMWALLEENDGRAVLPALIGYMAERRRHRERWVGALVRAQVPVRLVDGVADPVSGGHMVARYRELVPHPDVVELAGTGHFPQLEAPDAVLAAVLEHAVAAA